MFITVAVFNSLLLRTALESYLGADTCILLKGKDADGIKKDCCLLLAQNGHYNGGRVSSTW